MSDRTYSVKRLKEENLLLRKRIKSDSDLISKQFKYIDSIKSTLAKKDKEIKVLREALENIIEFCKAHDEDRIDGVGLQALSLTAAMNALERKV